MLTFVLVAVLYSLDGQMHKCRTDLKSSFIVAQNKTIKLPQG